MLITIQNILSLEQFGDIFLLEVSIVGGRKSAFIDAHSHQIKSYLIEHHWPFMEWFDRVERNKILDFRIEKIPKIECNDEIWYVELKGEMYENGHDLLTKSERYVWINYVCKSW